MTTDEEQGAIPDHGERGTSIGEASDEHGHSPMDYDAELRLHNDVLRRPYELPRDDHVLDIGGGTGQTAREAPRITIAGTVVGVDLAHEMIDRARELTKEEGLRNVTFLHADAQIHPFPPERFDAAISRFGTMFFSDPVAAFANIARSLRSEGRLVMMVWQAHEHNEWSVAIKRSLVGDEGALPHSREQWIRSRWPTPARLFVALTRQALRT